MVRHPPGRVENGPVASQHDRHVGGEGGEVGICREIDADQLETGSLSQGLGQSLGQGMYLGLDPITQDKKLESSRR